MYRMDIHHCSVTRLLVLIVFGTICLGKAVNQRDTSAGVGKKENNVSDSVAVARPMRMLRANGFKRTIPSLSVRPRTGSKSLEVPRYTQKQEPGLNHIESNQHTSQEKDILNHAESSQHTVLEKEILNHAESSAKKAQKQPVFVDTNSDHAAYGKQEPATTYTDSDNNQNQKPVLHDTEPGQDIVQEHEERPKYTKPVQVISTKQQLLNYKDSSYDISKVQPVPNYKESRKTMEQEQRILNYTESNNKHSSTVIAHEAQVLNYTDSSHANIQSQPVINYKDYTHAHSNNTIVEEPEQLLNYTGFNHNTGHEKHLFNYAEIRQRQQELNNDKSSHYMAQEQSVPNYMESRHNMTQEQSVPNYMESSQAVVPEQQIDKYSTPGQDTVHDQQKTNFPTRRAEKPHWQTSKGSVSPTATSSIQTLYYKKQQNNERFSHKDVSENDQHTNKRNFMFSVSTSANSSRKTQTDTPPCSVFLLNNDTIANCSFRHLPSVPGHEIPHTVTHLYIQGNLITKLLNNSFKNYTLLRILDLSSNKLSELEEFSFSGLEHLIVLNLSDNYLMMYNSTFPENIFSSLINLEELKLNKNNNSCKEPVGLNYPDKALSRLRSLKKLSMDGLSDIPFGAGFQNLTSLVELSMAGYNSGCCNMYALTNVTFQYLTQLKYLNISNCYIKGEAIHPEAFSPLRNLQSLDLAHNEDIDIENLDKVFYGLRNITTLKQLRMKLIVNRYSIGICLDSFYIRNFPQHLQHFDAQENNLEGVNRQVIGLLSPSLKTLDVSGNKFVFGTYLQDLHLMQNLIVLKINGGGFIYKFPNLYPYEGYLNRGGPNCTLYEEAGEGKKKFTHFSVILPPNLKVIEMNSAGLTYVLSNLTIDPNNKLENMSMNRNNFPVLEGPFVGLNHLKYLDVSSSYVKNISNKFFINLTSLEVLRLEGNLLGDFFTSQTNPQVFQPLSQLRYLDLSFNDIPSLPANIFSGLDSLETLLLKKNPLKDFDVDISHMNNLTLLNLTRSRVSQLSDRVREHIDDLIRRGQKITIDMSQCPIFCTCSNLDFLIWMKTSGAFASGSPFDQCNYEDGLSKYITDGYNSTIAHLTRQCSSNTVLFLCVAGAMVLMFCVILCSVLYRFRWKIRYLYYAAHLFYRSTKRKKESSEFEFDAFISYDEADDQFVVGKMARELEKRGLKLCIHGRDFRAGEYIASNIVRAVCVSRRTVVVLTSHMISSYWCKYEIQMANMEAIYTGRRVLLFLLMEKIPDDALGVELLYYIRNNTYIPYPDSLPDATSIGKLWDKLVADIRD